MEGGGGLMCVSAFDRGINIFRFRCSFPLSFYRYHAADIKEGQSVHATRNVHEGERTTRGAAEKKTQNYFKILETA